MPDIDEKLLKIKEVLKSHGWSDDCIDRTISAVERIAGSGEMRSEPEKDIE